MALVGLYLCSCGNKQIGKEELCGIWIQPVPRSHIVQGLKLTPDSLILRSSLVFCLALKLLNVDDEPLVSAFADKSALRTDKLGNKYWPNGRTVFGQIGELERLFVSMQLS